MKYRIEIVAELGKLPRDFDLNKLAGDLRVVTAAIKGEAWAVNRLENKGR